MSEDNIEAKNMEALAPVSEETLEVAAQCDCALGFGIAFARAEGREVAAGHLPDCAVSLAAAEVPPAPARPSYPPGYNPAGIPGHLPGPQHPSDRLPLDRAAVGEDAWARVMALAEGAPTQSVGQAVEDAWARAIATAAAQDFARTNAEGSRQSMETVATSAGAILTQGSSYKATLLHSLLVHAFIKGASFGTQLALERMFK